MRAILIIIIVNQLTLANSVLSRGFVEIGGAAKGEYSAKPRLAGYLSGSGLAEIGQSPRSQAAFE